ncbi:hypothetical protein J6590_065548 [Homalodisca vitripennis]|nr:hypothetical protein J6590_065548 [Homalodisca vitripennis]
MAISNHLVENVVSKESRVEESAEVKLSSAPEDGLVNNGTSTSRLTVFHQNVDRMGNKIERLNHNVDSIKLDIVVLTEHVRNDNSISNVNLINYRLVTSYSREFHRKGGIAIFARDSFGSQLEVINTHTQPGVNMRSCSYQDLYWQSKIFIHFWCSLYRPPGATLEEALTNGSQALELLPSRDEAVCVIGDLNVDSGCNSNHCLPLNELLALRNAQILSARYKDHHHISLFN